MAARRYKRKKGSHHILICPGSRRAVVISEYDEVDTDIIKNKAYVGFRGRVVIEGESTFPHHERRPTDADKHKELD